MMLLRQAICQFLAISIAACVVAGQSSSGPQTSPDPFILKRGASFTASTSSKTPKQIGQSRLSRTDVISLDINEALASIIRNHAFAADPEKLRTSSIRSMLHSLDPHSSYYDPTEFRDLLGEHKSEYSGTGAIIMSAEVQGTLQTFVIAVADGSPAARAGLGFGDRIIAVDGKETAGKSSYDVREAIRGPRGTSVVLLVERSASGSVENVTLRRQRLSQPTVPYAFKIDAGTGYIDLTIGFSFTTSSEIKTALSGLKRSGIKRLVIDLRGNGGGIFEQAVAAAEIFLPAGSRIVSQRSRFVQDNREWHSSNRHPETLPLILLVDKETASAAEIFAAAMQDNDRALIVGENTFGKGLVQHIVELENGGGLALTAARYFAPSGRSIQRDYSDGSIYDYYSRISQGALIDKAEYAARTRTGRTVFGGNGVAPDVAVKRTGENGLEPDLEDMIFLFARDVLGGRIPTASSRNDIRQKIIFGADPLDSTLVEYLHDLIKKSGNKVARAANENDEIIRKLLRYYLTLGAFGQFEARKTEIRNDKMMEIMPSAFSSADALAQAVDSSITVSRAGSK